MTQGGSEWGEGAWASQSSRRLSNRKLSIHYKVALLSLLDEKHDVKSGPNASLDSEAVHGWFMSLHGSIVVWHLNYTCVHGA